MDVITIPEQFSCFMHYEQTVNNHFQSKLILTDVPLAYRPESQIVFKLYYALVPVKELEIFDCELMSLWLKKELYVEIAGQMFVKFFVHVLSEDLYTPLLKKYPLQGYYLATPTSSTRTLLVWHPDEQPPRFFMVKLSMDVLQFGRNRALERAAVERAVFVTQEMLQVTTEQKQKYYLDFFSDVLGVCPLSHLNQPVDIARKLENTPKYSDQNGFLIREIPEHWQQTQTYPLFSLFAPDPKNNNSILVVDWWQKSGKSWEDFLKDNILRPIFSALGFLVFEKKYYLQAHAQNMIVQFDPKTLSLTKIYFRDLGSFFPLETPEESKDPKAPFFYYLFSYVFYHESTVSENSALVKAVPGYNSKKIHKIFLELYDEMKRQMENISGQ